MNIKLSLQEYAQLIGRINAEVIDVLKLALQGSDKFKIVAEEAIYPSTTLTVFAVHNATRRINLHSALIPFEFVESKASPVLPYAEDSQEFFATVDRAVLTMSSAWRASQYSPWIRNESFGDGGVLTVCIQPLDADAVEAAARLLANEIKSYLSFELEFAY